LPRKPADVAHINFRIREHLRRKIETAAKRHQVSLNSEMHARLEASFDDQTRNDFATIAQDISLRMADLDQLTSEMEAAWARLEATREMIALGDLMASEILDHGERLEWVKALAGLAHHWKRLHAAAELPLRKAKPTGGNS
jgi:hypothetical protein